jgi:dynein heavy chain, axonemal
MNEWQDDMRMMMEQVGLKEHKTVFLLKDSHIRHRAFLEDINNLLNTGEIPNLFQDDHIERICETLRPIAREEGVQESRSALYALFIDRCKANLHLAICMGPGGMSIPSRDTRFHRPLFIFQF